MGRGDGSERIVSDADADDSGTGILHVDMDAFYASVEMLDDPSLRGKPIVVGAPEGRSVVSSASYEARRFGVRSAMPVSQALRLCPQAIVVLPHFDRYLEISTQVMKIFHDVTPLVEPLSIDEAFLDVRGARRLWGSPGEIATSIRRRVQLETGITCSVGVASTKHVAKMASTICKPDGLLGRPGGGHRGTSCGHDRCGRCGGSARSPPSRSRAAASTPSPTCSTPRATCSTGPSDRRWVSASGTWRAGSIARSVSTTHIEKSVGHEETFNEDIADPAYLRAELLRLADRVAGRLRTGGWEASTVAIKVRFADFTTISRSQTLVGAVGRRSAHRRRGARAFRLHRPAPGRCGSSACAPRSCAPPGAAGVALWDDDAEWRRIDGALDDASARFGKGAVTRATFLGRAERQASLPSHPRPPKTYGGD